MTNFDFLKQDKQFDDFSNVAISAEQIFQIDYGTSTINCRRAMEFAIKWIYSVDNLTVPYDTTLINLMSSTEFKDLLNSSDLLNRLHFIRKLGNESAHKNTKVTKEMASLCLENLHIFMDFVACCYSASYDYKPFNKSLLEKKVSKEEVKVEEPRNLDLEKLLKENENLKAELSARREENQPNYVQKPLDITEYETRKIYIDVMLSDVGWVLGKNWVNEVEVKGMPNVSETGFIDYVLYGDDGKPLALVEAKRTCVDPVKGRQQAKLYADILEKQYKRRPVVFLTNGFDTKIVDGQYPERSVSGVYSKRDLEKFFNLKDSRKPLSNITINKNIAGRYYQEGAIKAVCDAFDDKNRRQALLVMATGSGKTRTVIELCNVLINNGFIKNVLFLADRTSLVKQAKKSFMKFLPETPLSNILENDKNYNANIIFSTYQTMMNCIDEAKDEDGKVFTAGHFDLVICDEAHRSIYNKYKDIFTYFDSLLIGLTATPKDEIDKNTYEVFNLEKGMPTYGYELAQAVKDGYLVDYRTKEIKTKFLEEGIVYDALSEEDKKAYEDNFADEDGNLPESIGSSALNKWIYNEDTIKKVLSELMTNGIKIDYGSKIGKTIIFAKNHRHAENIFEVFNKEYPELKDHAKVIDNYSTYAQSLIDEFSDPERMPQIAISVDMLDTGIDVPEVLNLVFFKKVMSKAKFWQMIGRGTRLCEGLIDNKDKEKFYIFDFCNNFEFFRIKKGRETLINSSVQEAIVNLKLQMAFKLQDIAYQTSELVEFRKELINDVLDKVKELNKENVSVRQHLRYVEKYSDLESYKIITYEETLVFQTEVAPLIQPYKDEPSAIRFDALMYAIELAYIMGENNKRAKNDLLRRVRDISGIAHVPEIIAKGELINRILNTDYIERADINDFEHIREEIRGLIKHIKKEKVTYTTNFEDDVLSIDWKESELENSDLDNYKRKAEFYIKEHQDNAVISKLKTNKPLTKEDISELESILWVEVGTKSDYDREVGEKPLGEFVRSIVGLDIKSAKEAFSVYLDNNNLDSRQIYFINQIVEYIVRNGMLKDFTVLQEAPFTDKGSIVDIFDDLTIWSGIKQIIVKINENVVA